MRGWPFLLAAIVAFLGFVGVSLWTHRAGPPTAPIQGPSVASPWPSSDRPELPQDGQPPAASRFVSSSVAPLLTALGVHQPPRRAAAPDFTLPDLEGHPVRLRQFQGKVVLLNFWATWCTPCRLEMPSMERLYQTFKRTEFVLVGVSLDRQGAAVVRPFVEELQLTFPIVLDATAEVARAYGVRGLPTTYLVDPDGQLIGAAVGGRDWARPEAKALIAGLLRQAAGLQEAPARP
jgi:peroxiredoxin